MRTSKVHFEMLLFSTKGEDFKMDQSPKPDPYSMICDSNKQTLLGETRMGFHKTIAYLKRYLAKSAKWKVIMMQLDSSTPLSQYFQALMKVIKI